MARTTPPRNAVDFKSSADRTITSKRGNVELTWGDGGVNRLRCRSIASFNGMESPVGILAEPERAHTGKQKVHLHVALTRAKHHVIVLGTLPDPESIQ